jgi:two-component system, OmpR family, sensor histidine kinase QseC
MPFARPRWLNSFSRQLLVATTGGVLFGAGLLVVSLFAMRMFQEDWFARIGVAEYAESMGERLQFDSLGQPVAVGSPKMAWLFEGLGREATYRVLDDKGAVVLSSEAGAGPMIGDGRKLVLTTGNFTFRNGDLTMHGATERVRHEGRTWYMQFAASERLSEMLRAYVGAPLFSRSVAYIGSAALVLYCFVMYFLLRRILRPLNEASAIAAEMSPRNLGARIRIHRVPTELRPLVENFNSALDRLEHNYRLQQEFLTSAAHELKTPLALIRGQIEIGVDETNRNELLQDVSRMGRQVQQLLHLAEASEPQNYTFDVVDAESLAREVAGYLERLAVQQGVVLQVAAEPGCVLARADHGAVFTLLKNLLENAIQHSHAGGVVRLQVTREVICVQDEGSGVAAEDLPHLFTRFWRGKERRDLGAGLGLSICREIATVHGWSLDARNEGRGMAFELRIRSA